MKTLRFQIFNRYVDRILERLNNMIIFHNVRKVSVEKSEIYEFPDKAQ